MTEDEQIALEKRKWKNRRYMAWISMWCMLGMAGATVLFDKQFIEAAFYAFASVVGAYMGFTTWYEKK